jgi:hypothetical protein
LWLAPEYLRCYFSAGTLLADCSYRFFPKEKFNWHRQGSAGIWFFSASIVIDRELPSEIEEKSAVRDRTKSILNTELVDADPQTLNSGSFSH